MLKNPTAEIRKKREFSSTVSIWNLYASVPVRAEEKQVWQDRKAKAVNIEKGLQNKTDN